MRSRKPRERQEAHLVSAVRLEATVHGQRVDVNVKAQVGTKSPHDEEHKKFTHRHRRGSRSPARSSATFSGFGRVTRQQAHEGSENQETRRCAPPPSHHHRTTIIGMRVAGSDLERHRLRIRQQSVGSSGLGQRRYRTQQTPRKPGTLRAGDAFIYRIFRSRPVVPGETARLAELVVGLAPQCQVLGRLRNAN